MRDLILESKAKPAQNLVEGLEQSMTSTGRVVGIEPVRGSSMYRLVYKDIKPGSFPERYSGRYTSLKEAEYDLRSYIKDTWEIAEAHNKSKNKVA
jgi:hypothetical protein